MDVHNHVSIEIAGDDHDVSPVAGAPRINIPNIPLDQTVNPIAKWGTLLKENIFIYDKALEHYKKRSDILTILLLSLAAISTVLASIATYGTSPSNMNAITNTTTNGPNSTVELDGWTLFVLSLLVSVFSVLQTVISSILQRLGWDMLRENIKSSLDQMKNLYGEVYIQNTTPTEPDDTFIKRLAPQISDLIENVPLIPGDMYLKYQREFSQPDPNNVKARFLK